MKLKLLFLPRYHADFGDYFTKFRERMKENKPPNICLNCGIINLTKSLQRDYNGKGTNS